LRIEKHYSLDAMGERLLGLYEKCRGG
jgi:hypothetical protein